MILSIKGEKGRSMSKKSILLCATFVWGVQTAWGAETFPQEPKITPGDINNISMRDLIISLSNTSINLMSSFIFTKLSETMHSSVETFYSRARRIAEKGARASYEFLSNHRWKVAGGTIAFVYAYLLYKTIALRGYLSERERWFNWYDYLPFEALCAYPQKDLGNDLVKEIQQRYTNLTSPTDFVTPLITFLKILEVEQYALEQYLFLCRWIERFHLTIITAHNKEFIIQCEAWKRRLVYLKATFMRWMAEFKFEQNAQLVSRCFGGNEIRPTFNEIGRLFVGLDMLNKKRSTQDLIDEVQEIFEPSY